MSPDDPPASEASDASGVADDDLFGWAWVALAVGLLALASFGAVGVYQWYLKATVRPTDDLPTERRQ